MGSNNGKHVNQKENNKRRSSFKRILRISSSSSRQTNNNNTQRPISYAGINQYYDDHEISARPMSMIDVGPIENLKLDQPEHISSGNLNNIPTETDMNPVSRCSSPEILKDESSDQTASDFEYEIQRTSINKSNENHWEFYIPLTIEKIQTITVLKDFIYQCINAEFTHILNRLFRLENTDGYEGFSNWFLDEIEYYMHSIDDDSNYSHKPLLIRSVEQDRFDCTKYLLEYHLLPSKLDINTVNDQGRHCLLMLSHKNGPIDLIKYLLTHHLSCLDTNKIDLNSYSSLHHACRHFNLSLCEVLLPYTSRQILQVENSELHTPLDYWLECLCSLKKLKPTHLQYGIDSLRLDYLLNNPNILNSNVYFFQTLINRGGQLTKLPLRYIRSIIPQLSFEQKFSYIDHHVNLCCILYKNRLSTLMPNYDKFKTSIQASEVLTEFIYALGTVQVEIQNRLAENACSQKEHSIKFKEHELLQSKMRLLYGKFFRLFDCIYTNPDVNVKNFHFEHIFRRVWVYWKEPVQAYIKQSREKSLSLKAICRFELFKHLINYPGDILNLSMHSSLKQFLAFDNQFFIVQRKVAFQ